MKRVVLAAAITSLVTVAMTACDAVYDDAKIKASDDVNFVVEAVHKNLDKCLHESSPTIKQQHCTLTRLALNKLGDFEKAERAFDTLLAVEATHNVVAKKIISPEEFGIIAAHFNGAWATQRLRAILAGTYKSPDGKVYDFPSKVKEGVLLHICDVKDSSVLPLLLDVLAEEYVWVDKEKKHRRNTCDLAKRLAEFGEAELMPPLRRLVKKTWHKNLRLLRKYLVKGDPEITKALLAHFEKDPMNIGVEIVDILLSIDNDPTGEVEKLAKRIDGDKALRFVYFNPTYHYFCRKGRKLGLDAARILIERDLSSAAELANNYDCLAPAAVAAVAQSLRKYLKAEVGPEDKWIEHYRELEKLCKKRSFADCKVLKDYEVADEAM